MTQQEIDRIEDAISELQSAIDLIKQDGKDWLDERDIPILEMAIKALEESRWIPCKERLPGKIEKNYWVCTDKHGWQCMCKWRKYPSKRGDFWAWHINAHVVAWKPLSESYKEEENE